MTTDITRRQFIYSTAAAGAVALAKQAFAWRLQDTKLRVLSIGVVGTIGEADRQNIAKHPRVEIVGLCDVDDEAMEKAAQDHPDAFRCTDYREAFDKHGDKFDAVIVAVPDHAHCSVMTMALSRGKHVYGQKPLVHELEELEILSRSVQRHSKLVTQTGAQRIEHAPRRAAVDILKSCGGGGGGGGGGLGKVLEIHIPSGGSAYARGTYFADGVLKDPIDPPKGFNYDLWLCGAQYEPCRPEMVQRQWRSWWRFGGGQIADWTVHLTDVLFYAFPELSSPIRVCSRTPSRDLSYFHADHVLSTITFDTSAPAARKHFANSLTNLYYYDSHMTPDRAQIGVGEGLWPGQEKKEGEPPSNPPPMTIVVCEGGTMVLAPEGPLEIWQKSADGKPTKTDGMQWPGLPKYEKFSHWHAWVDKCLGEPTQNRWMPFEIGLKCTEPGLLAVKACRYPGHVLEWDRSRLAFTNHAQATASIVRRAGGYRKGFEPVR
jgi:predicted dehydrogenase